jgi:23S rRNA (guanosine2251-2'-O)-methyltransferase
VSAGAVDHVAVSQVGNVTNLIAHLKERGFWIYGVDPSAPNRYTAIDMTGPLALVFGGEGKGVRPGVLKACDGLISIPMKGKVESLNVSAAVAVVVYEGVRQRGGVRSVS